MWERAEKSLQRLGATERQDHQPDIHVTLFCTIGHAPAYRQDSRRITIYVVIRPAYRQDSRRITIYVVVRPAYRQDSHAHTLPLRRTLHRHAVPQRGRNARGLY